MSTRGPNARDSFRDWDVVRLELEQVLAHVDGPTFDWKPVAHAKVRSIGDILRHLCDSEAYWIDRVVRGNEWIRHEPGVWADPDAVRERWRILREQTNQFLESLAVARLADTKIDHRGNIVTVRWIVWHVLQHEAHHRGQIYQLLRLRNPDRPSLIE